MMIITNISNFSDLKMHALSDQENEYNCDQRLSLKFDLCCDFDAEGVVDEDVGADGHLDMIINRRCKMQI